MRSDNVAVETVSPKPTGSNISTYPTVQPVASFSLACLVSPSVEVTLTLSLDVFFTSNFSSKKET